MTEAQKTDLREKVARAVFDYLGPDNAFDYPGDLQLSPYADAAEAALAIARPAIIEECAKEAEDYVRGVAKGEFVMTGPVGIGRGIAAAIRALAEKP